jgi:hypothetical protein
VAARPADEAWREALLTMATRYRGGPDSIPSGRGVLDSARHPERSRAARPHDQAEQS